MQDEADYFLNLTFKHNPASDEQLRRCWAQQNCGGCLDQDRCSWCPFTQSCVPNNYAIPPLAPAYDEDICPHWAERWEIRTSPLGCQVSTITSLTCIISVVSALLFVLLSFLAIRGARRLGALHRQHPGWWKVWAYEWPAGIKPSNWRPSAWKRDRDWRQRQPLLGTRNESPGISHASSHDRGPAV